MQKSAQDRAAMADTYQEHGFLCIKVWEGFPPSPVRSSNESRAGSHRGRGHVLPLLHQYPYLPPLTPGVGLGEVPSTYTASYSLRGEDPSHILCFSSNFVVGSSIGTCHQPLPSLRTCPSTLPKWWSCWPKRVPCARLCLSGSMNILSAAQPGQSRAGRG